MNEVVTERNGANGRRAEPDAPRSPKGRSYLASIAIKKSWGC
jgi:hypothetical protein